MNNYEYEGILQEYFETGMEQLGLILQDNRGMTPNPQYDPKINKYPHNIPMWHSLSYAVFFRGGEDVEIYAKDGSIEYKGKLTKDREAMKKVNYAFSFIPKEVPLETWIRWFREERKAKAWSSEKPLADQK